MEVCSQSSWTLHILKASHSHHLAGRQWCVGLNWHPGENLAAAGNAVSSTFAVDFLPAHWKGKDKLKQMEKDSWENSLWCSKVKGAWFDNSGRVQAGGGCDWLPRASVHFLRCPEALHGQFWLILMACTGGSSLFSYPTEGWAGIHHPSCCEICCMWYFSLLVTELTSQLLITAKCGSEAFGGQGHFWFQKLSGYHKGITHYCRI